jgi:hypothetical protein
MDGEVIFAGGCLTNLFFSRSAHAAASTVYSGTGAVHGRRYATLSPWVDFAPVGGLAFNADGGLVLVVLGNEQAGVSGTGGV